MDHRHPGGRRRPGPPRPTSAGPGLAPAAARMYHRITAVPAGPVRGRMQPARSAAAADRAGRPAAAAAALLLVSFTGSPGPGSACRAALPARLSTGPGSAVAILRRGGRGRRPAARAPGHPPGPGQYLYVGGGRRPQGLSTRRPGLPAGHPDDRPRPGWPPTARDGRSAPSRTAGAPGRGLRPVHTARGGLPWMAVRGRPGPARSRPARSRCAAGDPSGASSTATPGPAPPSSTRPRSSTPGSPPALRAALYRVIEVAARACRTSAGPRTGWAAAARPSAWSPAGTRDELIFDPATHRGPGTADMVAVPPRQSWKQHGCPAGMRVGSTRCTQRERVVNSDTAIPR